MTTLGTLILFLTGAATLHLQGINRKAVDAIIEQALKEWQVPGVAVAIVKDDKVVYLEGHGVREIGKFLASPGESPTIRYARPVQCDD